MNLESWNLGNLGSWALDVSVRAGFNVKHAHKLLVIRFMFWSINRHCEMSKHILTIFLIYKCCVCTKRHGKVWRKLLVLKETVLLVQSINKMEGKILNWSLTRLLTYSQAWERIPFMVQPSWGMKRQADFRHMQSFHKFQERLLCLFLGVEPWLSKQPSVTVWGLLISDV